MESPSEQKENRRGGGTKADGKVGGQRTRYESRKKCDEEGKKKMG